ncbi:MAG: immunoglobulin domain-containing protein [Phycisphaerales bacterium]|nr:immunoglobulin domain-containing protein [Phycisphaerales bacterium]
MRDKRAILVLVVLPVGAVVAPAEGLNAQGCASWTESAATGPSARYAHAMAYDSAHDRVVLFGGVGAALPYLADTWEWDGDGWSLVADAGPAARVDHAMAFDSARGKIVLFGGQNGTGALGDTWEWDGDQWTQRNVIGPMARAQHSMVFDAQRGRVVLFGGGSIAGLLGDTWEWNGEAWSQPAATGPSARSQHAMAFDSVRGRAVLFGGFDGQVRGDTWEWDGSQWAQTSSTGPAPRVYHSMAFDQASNRTVVFGGNDGIHPFAPADTWKWDGSRWEQLSPETNPGGRWYASLVFAGSQHRNLLFGGYVYRDGVQGDTWSLELDPAIIEHPSSSTTDALQSAVLAVAGQGSETLAYQWRKSGAEIIDGGNVSGATTSTLTINPVHMSDAGTYDCVVSNVCGSVTSDPATLTVICYGDIAPALGGGDNLVNINDLLEIIGEWGPCNDACPEDIAPPPEGDNTVNLNDLLAVINAWGPCP